MTDELLNEVLGSGCVYPATTKTLPNQLTSAGERWKVYLQGAGGPACHVPKLGSDLPQAAGDRTTHRKPAGGYDVGPQATVRELREEARELKIAGRSKMSKAELKQAILRKAGRQV